MEIKELQAKRKEVLETRELNRAKGDNFDPQLETECNTELCKLNLAIQGVEPYEVDVVPEPVVVEEAPKKRRPRRKKSDEDILK